MVNCSIYYLYKQLGGEESVKHVLMRLLFPDRLTEHHMFKLRSEHSLN